MAEPIRDVVEALHAALTRGDIGWFEERLASGPCVHITTTAEGWMSRAAFLEGLRRQFAEVALEWTAGEVVVEERGEMAWVADRAVVRFDDGSTLAARMSLVFVRDDGLWRLAHSHLTTGD